MMTARRTIMILTTTLALPGCFGGMLDTTAGDTLARGGFLAESLAGTRSYENRRTIIVGAEPYTTGTSVLSSGTDARGNARSGRMHVQVNGRWVPCKTNSRSSCAATVQTELARAEEGGKENH